LNNNTIGIDESLVLLSNIYTYRDHSLNALKIYSNLYKLGFIIISILTIPTVINPTAQIKRNTLSQSVPNFELNQLT
jgi:hypothetical protein